MAYKDMSMKRWQELMNRDDTELTDEEYKDGWHFCYEFDGLLVYCKEATESGQCGQWCVDAECTRDESDSEPEDF